MATTTTAPFNPWQQPPPTTAAPASSIEKRDLALALCSGTALCFWVRLVYYGDGFQITGEFVRVIGSIVWDIQGFFVMVIVIVLGFAHCLFLFYSGGRVEDESKFDSIWRSILTCYQMMLGEFPMHDLEESAITMTLYFFFSLSVTVILLNLLIAKMSESYASVMEKASGQLLLNKARIISKIEMTWSYTIRLAFASKFNTWLCADHEMTAQSEESSEIRQLRSTLERMDQQFVNLKREMKLLTRNVKDSYAKQTEHSQGDFQGTHQVAAIQDTDTAVADLDELRGQKFSLSDDGIYNNVKGAVTAAFELRDLAPRPEETDTSNKLDKVLKMVTEMKTRMDKYEAEPPAPSSTQPRAQQPFFKRPW